MGSVVAPILGAHAAQGQLDAANAAREQALQQYMGINAPSVADQQLALQQYQNAGNLTPQAEQALQMGPTAMAGIQTDPRLAQAQMTALQQLSQTGQMGMTPAEAAALADAQRNAQSQAQAKSAQLMDEFARRGMGGSGAELASRLQNSQSAADRLNQSSNQVAQNAQQNALQAISQSGGLAGQMQGQQFGQQEAIARAKDYINQFNTQNSQNVQNTNVQTSNAAALRNLMNQQSLMNQNTQLGNQQQQYNKQLLQQQFNNQMGLAAGRAGQYQGIAQMNQQNAGRTADMYAGIGQGVDTGAGALYNAYSKSNDGSNFEDYGSAGTSNYSQPMQSSTYSPEALPANNYNDNPMA
jgi:hypothetical protein